MLRTTNFGYPYKRFQPLISDIPYLSDEGNNVVFMSDVYHGPSFKMIYEHILKNDQGLKEALTAERLIERSSSYINIVVEREMKMQVVEQTFDTITDAMQYVLENLK